MKARFLPLFVAVVLTATSHPGAQRSGDATGRAVPRDGASSTTPGLVQSSDLVYEGAFRLPERSGQGPLDVYSFNGGGGSMAFHEGNRTLLVGGSGCCTPTLAEVTIPDIRQATTLDQLAIASYRQTHVDILRGRAETVGCGGPVGGVLPWSNGLIASVYCVYDGGHVQSKSHFLTGMTFANLPTVRGPFEIATGTSESGRAGYVSGYMTTVPPEWQAALGGPALTGNCCLSVITRTNWGPGLSAFNPDDVGVKDPVPASTLIRYTADHPSLGRCDSDGNARDVVFNCTTLMGGVVFPAGTRSVLFIGSRGMGDHCYGDPTNNPALHETFMPDGSGVLFCYDPSSRGGKGPHGFPYAHHVWAYDANDLARVKAGRAQPWQIKPYATWTFETPFQLPERLVTGVAYDAATRRVFVGIADHDRPRPLVHVFRVRIPDGSSAR